MIFVRNKYYYLDMDKDQFLRILTANQCELKENMEQQLYNAFMNQPQRKKISQVVHRSCLPSCIQKTMETIQTILQLKQFAKTCHRNFIDQKFVSPNHFIDLIRSHRQNRKTDFEKIIQEYGMRQEYEKDFNTLFSEIQIIQKRLSIFSQQIWMVFQTTIIEEAKINKQILLLEETIDTPIKLRDMALRFKIFIIQDRQYKIFQFCNNLGVNNTISQQIIAQSTYEAYLISLKRLCSKIDEKKSAFNPNQILKSIISILQDNFFLNPQQILTIIKYTYFEQQQAQFKQIISKYQLQEIIQEIKAELIKLTNHLQKNFRKYEAQRIVEYYKKIVEQAIQNQQQTFNIDYRYQYKKSILKSVVMQGQQQQDREHQQQNHMNQQQTSFVSKNSLKKNPFQIKDIEPPNSSQKLKVLLIYYSNQGKVKRIDIFKDQYKEVDSNYPRLLNCSFVKNNYSFAHFIIDKSQSYNLKVQLSNQNSLKIPIKIVDVYKDCSLVFINNKQGSQQNLDSAHNHVLLQGIYFMVEKIVYYSQFLIFPWLKLFYDSYKKEIKDQRIFLNFLTKDYYFNETSGRFFIYFLCSIYGQQVLYYYQQYKLTTKIEFPTNLKSQIGPKLPQIEKFHYFYNQLHILYMFRNKKRFGQQQFKKSIFLLIEQKSRNPLKIFIKISKQYPQSSKIFCKYNNEISQLFKLQKKYCSHDYFEFTIKYLKNSFVSSPRKDQQTILFKFIDDLINLFRERCLKCKKWTNINHQQVLNVFITQTKFGRELRIQSIKSLPLLYSKCKILKNISLQKMDFVSIVIAYVQNKIDQLTKQYKISTFVSALTIPFSKFDQQLIIKICQSSNALLNKEIVQLIRLMIRDRQMKYDIKIFQKIFSSYIKNQKILIQPAIVLPAIDDCYKEIIDEGNFKQFLNSLFLLISSEISISQKSKIKQDKFQKHVSAYSKIRYEKFKNIYWNKILDSLQSNFTKKQELQGAFFNLIDKIFPQKNLQKKYVREHLINKYLIARSFTVENIEKQIFAALKTNDSNLILNLNKLQIVNVQNAFRKVTTVIKGCNILSEDIKLYRLSIESQIKNIPKELKNSIEEASKKIYDFQNQIFSSLAVFQKKQQVFNGDIDTLKGYLKQMSQNQLYIIFQIVDKKYAELFKIIDKIYIIQQYPSWSFQKIQNIQDLIQTFKKIQKKLLLVIANLQYKPILYNEFQEYFGKENFRDICTFYVKKNTDKEVMLNKYSVKLSSQYIRRIIKFSQSLNQLNLVIKTFNFNMNMSTLNNFLHKIEKKEDFKAIDLIQQIQKKQNQLVSAFFMKNQLKGKQFIIQQMSQHPIVQVIESTHNQQRLFHMIDKKKINYKSIGNLKEYINDLQNSILKMETIKQFQNVLLYWEVINKAPNFEDFIKTLRKFIENRNVDLSISIKDCSASYKLLEQKIDEALNRQTSFKYQVKALLQSSFFQITEKLEIQFVKMWKKIPENPIKVANQQNQEIIDYKSMNNYKDKSILLINDIESDQGIDQNIKELMTFLKKYNQLFQVCEEIYHIINKLSNYGYDPKYISAKIKIQNCEYYEIFQKRNQLVRVSQFWLKGIKQLYSQSYLLTHFIGSELNKFIDNCIQKKYTPNLLRIMQMSLKQFEGQFSKHDFNLELKDAKPLQRAQRIIQIFKKFQSRFIASKRLNKQQFDLASIKSVKPIILLSCSANQIYSNFVQFDLSSFKITQPTQVLYCEQSTSAQQIEFFLDRAMIHKCKKHFIIGAHNLKQQIKLNFCDQLAVLINERFNDVKSSQLCFIDNVINDKIYAYLSRPKVFDILKKELSLKQADQGEKSLVKLIKDKTIIISSQKAGLGKTFFVQQQAKIKGKQLKYLPICGNVSFQRLSKRLKDLNLSAQNSLLIQIGNIQNKKKFQVFLSQIIIFRSFYFEEYIFIPQNIEIYIELQNTIEFQPKDSYHILNILKKYGKIHNIERFDLRLIHIDEQNYQDKFVYIYLSLLNRPNWITKNQYSFQDYQKQKHTVPLPENIEQLLSRYFLSWFNQRQIQPTYLIFKSFKSLLFNAFKSFSQSAYFLTSNFQEIEPQFKNLQLQKSRQNFLLICISNALQSLTETVKVKDFYQYENNSQSMSKNLKKFPMLIVSSNNFVNYQFIYLDDESVNISIKALLLSQNKQYIHIFEYMDDIQQIHQAFKQSSLSNCDGQQMQLRMFKILLELSGNKNFSSAIELIDDETGQRKYIQEGIQNIYRAVPQLNDYKLTLDNFFKMCLIIHRSNSHIPSIIMGQSGVGKTALISFLVKVVFQQQLQVFNIHAGIHEVDLQNWVKLFQAKAKQLQKRYNEKEIKSKRLWVFFDQYNTTDELFYIKEMIIDRRFLGEPLHNNIVFLAACNPYRKKQQSFNKIPAGIKKNRQKDSELAFKVKPLPLSMMEIMWDYKQLGERQCQCYIQKMLSEVKYKRKEELIKIMVYTHQLFKKTVEVSSVSLRDVSRFRQLFHWFLDNKPTKPNKKQNNLYDQYGQSRNQSTERAIILAFCFCYAFRYSTSSQRKSFLQNIQSQLSLKKQHMQKILERQQIEYINQLKTQGQKVAYNTSLMQNVFTSLVCLMNRIPIIIIGNPGSSKSLSIKMLNSNLRGENSTAIFCQKLPEINMIYYQGSQTSTSKGVEQAFQKASNSNNIKNMLNCILFDEIGLAEKSIHNPLKVLHSKLQTNRQKVGFIAISNWQLDCAKMSRFLILSRSNPDENELRDTSAKICLSYVNNKMHVEKIKPLGSHYYYFINKWKYHYNNKEGFFGLRDFYSYIKYVCAQINQYGNDRHQIDKAIAEAIQINFDGQKGSLKLFRQIASSSTKISNFFMNPIQVVHKNLENTQSRCLMLIIRGDSLIPIINDKIMIKSEQRKVICIYGSTFLEDQQSQQYNLEKTSFVINHVSRGNILAFKDINNSIQTSFYDLFNKSYTQIGSKRYCRIAVGANSNPKCNVHPNFNAIVYVDQQKLEDMDFAFLNRFEKHYLNLNSMITSEQISLLQYITDWINQLLSFKNESPTILKNQNFLINSSEQSIVTLIIKYRGDQNRTQRIKMDLLKNMTTDFTIAIKNDFQKRKMINKLVRQITPAYQCNEDMIIFTYDEFSNLSEKKKYKKSYIIRLSQITNEKALRKQLTLGFNSKQCENVSLKLIYGSHSCHINFILFLAKQIKGSLQSSKQILIIIELHRFSLIRLKIQTINISYLHKYHQYFVQDIGYYQYISDLLISKNCWQVYQKLKLNNRFNNYYTETLKLIKYQCQYQQNLQLKQMYFFQCLQLGNNLQFKKNAQAILQRYLQQKLILFNELQTKTENVIYCSNIKQAFQKYIEEKVIEILFYTVKMIIEEGFLFHFTQKRSLKLIHKNHLNYLIESYKKEEKQLIQFFKAFFQQQCNKMINLALQRKQNIYIKASQSNIIQIRSEIGIFYCSFKDFGILFKDELKNIPSLQQIAQKIPSLSNQQDNNDQTAYFNATCFIQSKFRISSSLISKQISKSKDLQRLYLYDLLTFYFNKKKQDFTCVCQFIEMMMINLKQYPLSDKLIILANDKKLMTNTFQLLSLLIKNEKINIYEEIGMIPKNKTDNPMVQILKKLFQIVMKLPRISKNIIERYGSLGRFITYLRYLLIKIYQIFMIYKQYGLKLSKDFITTNKMLQMFQKIQMKSQMKKQQLFQMYISDDDTKHSIYYCVNKLCIKLLRNQRTVSSEQIIINFLRFDIYDRWLQKIKESNQFKQQKDQCIQSFVRLCNNFADFASSSGYFISLMLPKFDQAKSVADVQTYFCKMKYLLKKDHINTESNFTVALLNFFSQKIEQILQQQIASDEEIQAQIIQKYSQQFKNLSKSIEEQMEIFTLFKIQFMKRYVYYYLQLVIIDQSNNLLNEIDKILCKNNQIMKHLRIYLLKLLYDKYNSFGTIKKKFIQITKCNWISKVKDLLQENEYQFIIPPQIQPNQKLQALLFNLLTEKNLQKTAFHSLITEALKNAKNKYKVLNYFMQYFYRKQVSQNFTSSIIFQLQNMNCLRQQKNNLFKHLLVRYLNHKVTHYYQYTNNNEFMNQIPLFNYLNIIVATSQQNNPLSKMFFNKNSTVPFDYYKYLDCRYLIGSMKNPALSRLQFILKRHKQGYSANSYISCSKQCDYICPVGGTFYGQDDGCHHPLNQSNCPFCGNIIGSNDQNQYYQEVVLTNFEGTLFKPEQIQSMQPVIKKRTKITLRKVDVNFEYNLLGYTLGNSKQKLLQSLQLRKQCQNIATDFLVGSSQMIHHKLLQTIINFVWAFLVDIKFINESSLQEIFNYNTENSKIFLNQATNFYFQQTNRSIQFINKEDQIIWHLGIGKMLLNLLIQYKQLQDLTNAATRDNFEKKISEFLFPFYQKEKEAVINKSRNIKTINTTDVICERGDFKHHLIQYPWIKLYKLVKIELRPSYQNMKNYFKNTLKEDYPILNYLMNNEEAEQKLKNFKIIFTFLSKLWKKINHQITRQESKKSLNQVLNDHKNLKAQLDLFVTSWNSLAKFKYKLKHQCHDFGQLKEIKKDYPLKNFLLDKNHMDNAQGSMLIGLIITSVNQYNSICKKLQMIIKQSYSQFAEIFSSNSLNPFKISEDSKLLIFPTQFLKQVIKKYSSFSVNYGIFLPTYPFDQIQSIVAKKFYGYKYLNDDEDKFCYIKYIGEQYHIITELRQDQCQKILEQTNHSQRIQKYLKNASKEQTFYKTLKNIQKSLETIIIHFKNLKQIPNQVQTTLKNFVETKKIHDIASEFFQQPIGSLPLCNLANFYETVELLRFEKVQNQLEVVYKKQLIEAQKKQIVELIKAMKRVNRQPKIPSYNDFKIAIYRLAGRNLLLMRCDERKYISEQLLYVSSYWPKTVNIDDFEEQTPFTLAMKSIKLQKIGEILKLVPLKDRNEEAVSRPSRRRENIRYNKDDTEMFP